MSDPYELGEYLLGRLDVVRSNVDQIIYELGLPRTHEGDADTKKIQSSTKTTNTKAATPSLEKQTPAANIGSNGTKSISLSEALQLQLEKVDKNLNFLSEYGLKFEATTNSINAQALNAVNRNMLVEAQWKDECQQRARKLKHYWKQMVSDKFPNNTMYQENKIWSGTRNMYFQPRPAKRARLHPASEKQPTNIDELLESIAQKHSMLTFYKQSSTSRQGVKNLSAIKCEVNREFSVYITFNPPVSHHAIGSLSESPAALMSPSTPASPATSFAGTISSRRKTTEKIKPKKKKEDMATKVKQAAEEASKQDLEELNARIESAREAAREQDVARTLGLDISSGIERISIVSSREETLHGAWSQSKYMVFRRLTDHAKEAMSHFCTHYPENSLRHFFAWISMYVNIFETKCASCEKILSKDSDDSMFLPPTMRDYASGKAYHTRCLPEFAP